MERSTRTEDRDDGKREPFGNVWGETTELCWWDLQLTGHQPLWACDPPLCVCVFVEVIESASLWTQVCVS